jgi:hypothetical protein
MESKDSLAPPSLSRSRTPPGFYDLCPAPQFIFSHDQSIVRELTIVSNYHLRNFSSLGRGKEEIKNMARSLASG